MNYYQELTILPDPDINMYFIWQKLYTQLHIALADLYNQHGIDTVGISFPNYKYEAKADKNGNVREFATLGNKLRIFAPTEDALTKLDIKTWLERLTDYVHIKGIKVVPDDVIGHLIVSRYRHTPLVKQVQSYMAHSQHKHGKTISEAEAIAHCKQHKRAGRKNYPFIALTSQDTKQRFTLAIKQMVTETALKGVFNTYGINTNNQQHTVPHW